MPVQTLYVSIQTRMVQQQGMRIYYPEVTGLQNMRVQQSINQEITQMVRHLMNQQYQKQEANQFAEMIGTYEIKTNERGVLSLTMSNYAIAPQHANGLTIIKALTFNIENGKSFQLKDLFKPGSNYVHLLSRLVRKQIDKRDIPIINEFNKISPNQDFYIADKSLVLFFQPIEITPHYFGAPMFPISVYELEEDVNENSPLGKMLEP